MPNNPLCDSVCMFGCFPYWGRKYLSVSQSVCSSVSLSLCLFVCLSVCPSVCLAVCGLPVHLCFYPFMYCLPICPSCLPPCWGLFSTARESCCSAWHNLRFDLCATAQIFLLDMEGGFRGHASGQRWHEDLQWAHRLDEGWNLAAVKQVSCPTHSL